MKILNIKIISTFAFIPILIFPYFLGVSNSNADVCNFIITRDTSSIKINFGEVKGNVLNHSNKRNLRVLIDNELYFDIDSSGNFKIYLRPGCFSFSILNKQYKNIDTEEICIDSAEVIKLEIKCEEE